MQAISKTVELLLERGVVIPNPAAVEVAESVNPAYIAPGVVIHTGCKLAGEQTSIGPDCVLGAEAPVTVEDCQLGKGVKLKGGYFSSAVFLDGAGMGSGAHVRAGTLLEEQANGAHTVGLKQTIFLPFVTAGSLINFCDALMAGGTSRKDHSEIGSSYVHFNFTPHGDKATPSLIGDVPRGVMLDQSPIFLGGQGGLVGPARIEYGCVIPAGVINRKDGLEPDMLLPGLPAAAQEPRPYQMGVYKAISRIVVNNLIYIGNIRALEAWYKFVRQGMMSSDKFSKSCYEGALRVLAMVVEERIKRLEQLAGKIEHSVELISAGKGGEQIKSLLAQQKQFVEKWPELERSLRAGMEIDVGGVQRKQFLGELEKLGPEDGYLEVIATLPKAAKKVGSEWLQAIVDATAGAEDFASV